MSGVRNEQQELIGIKCDMPECDTIAPDVTTIAQNHGLVRMGWWCKGGRHLCPAHHPDTL